MQTLAKLIELGWGTEDPAFRQVFSTEFMPDASTEQLRSFNEMMRLSTSAGTAVKIYRTFSGNRRAGRGAAGELPDAGPAFRGDLRAPFEEGRLIAAWSRRGSSLDSRITSFWRANLRGRRCSGPSIVSAPARASSEPSRR
jgi:hypothetical protein